MQHKYNKTVHFQKNSNSKRKDFEQNHTEKLTQSNVLKDLTEMSQTDTHTTETTHSTLHKLNLHHWKQISPAKQNIQHFQMIINK